MVKEYQVGETIIWLNRYHLNQPKYYKVIRPQFMDPREGDVTKPHVWVVDEQGLIGFFYTEEEELMTETEYALVKATRTIAQ